MAHDADNDSNDFANYETCSELVDQYRWTDRDNSRFYYTGCLCAVSTPGGVTLEGHPDSVIASFMREDNEAPAVSLMIIYESGVVQAWMRSTSTDPRYEENTYTWRTYYYPQGDMTDSEYRELMIELYRTNTIHTFS